MANDGCLAALPRFLAALMGTSREPSVDDYYLRNDWMSPAETSTTSSAARSATG